MWGHIQATGRGPLGVQDKVCSHRAQFRCHVVASMYPWNSIYATHPLYPPHPFCLAYMPWFSASPKPRDDSLQRSRARSVTPRRERRMEEGSNSCRRRASPDRREVSQSRGVDKRAMHSGESHSRASQLASGGAGAQKRNLIRVKMKEAGTPGPGAYMQVDNWVKKSHNVRSASPKPGRPTTAAGTLRRSKHV